jgi:cystathionine beta-lyase
MKNETKLIHKGRKPSKHFGTVNPPLYSSSTLIFPTLDAYEKAESGKVFYEPIFDASITDPAYGITGNQTTFALQEIIKDIEGGKICLITSSGLSSITVSLQSFLKSGDHALIADTVYGPTRRFCNKILAGNGVEITYYDPEIGAGIDNLVKANTKVIFLESPGSLTFEIQDIDAIVKVAKSKNICTIIDNSWASPLYFSPLKHGIDISIHAITKYINGHADILLGAITGNEKVVGQLSQTYKNLGIHASPHDCYQALRGIRTLNARLEYQRKSLDKVIEFLSSQKCVKEILCPSYKKFKGYELWKKYFTGSTPLFSIVLDKEYDKQHLSRMIDGYKYFSIGASWGGYESLVRLLQIEPVRSVTCGKYKGTVIRYYLGLEDVDDLIQDLEEGFKRLAD